MNLLGYFGERNIWATHKDVERKGFDLQEEIQMYTLAIVALSWPWKPEDASKLKDIDEWEGLALLTMDTVDVILRNKIPQLVIDYPRGGQAPTIEVPNASLIGMLPNSEVVLTPREGA